MSEYYDHYHRWEPLAEFHFNLNDSDDEYDDENYLYCLCSRAYIRDGVKLNYVDKEDGSESDMEVLRDTGSQGWENESHVHFSLDTSYKVKCEKDEGASCYCSASHTDNCCSTDEHDAAQIHGTSHALQPSDSGADLTYQECHSENTIPEKIERMDQDYSNTTENYLSEATWDKFWAVNGERLIWASWIKKYSDYINPGYLDENNDLTVDDSNIPKQRSVDQIYKESETKNDDDSIRERKFSYDSKVNPYKKGHGQNQPEKWEKIENKDESWLPCSRRRSCSEHERIVSPRTLAGTDSMTNVTKITLSSYDVTSSHVTSESTPSDDYSVSSTTSDDQSNDQTRIANVENADPTSTDDMDSDQYWQFLWKKHFGEQYALHYANYIVSHISQEKGTDLPSINIELTSPNEEKANKTIENQDIQEKGLDIECENSDGNSQELPTIIESEVKSNNQMTQDFTTQVQQINTVVEKQESQMKKIQAEVENVKTKVEEIQLQDPEEKPKKRGKKKSNKFLGSVGILLQNLLKEDVKDENIKETEVTDTGDGKNDSQGREQVIEAPKDNNQSNANLQQSTSNTNFTSYSYDDGDDEPPEETPINLKRSHEIDHEEAAAEKIKTTFQIMGFSVEGNKLPKGQMVFRKRLARLRPPRHKNNKRFGAAKKTYFDDDGNPILEQSKDSQDEREMQTDDDIPCPDFRSEALRLLNSLDQEDGSVSQVKKDKNTITNKSDDTIGKSTKVKKVEHINEDMNIDISDIDKSIKTETKDKKIKMDIINTSSNVCVEVDNKEMSIDVTKATKDVTKLSDDKEPTIKENIFRKNDKQSKENEITENSPIKAVESTENAKETILESKYTNFDVQNNVNNIVEESIAMQASEMPLPDDLDQSSDEKQDVLESSVSQTVETTRRRRRQKRHVKLDEEESSAVPEELRDDPKMMKYWKKRHSLFHRFDEGIQLDRESWFSVTPENVARHIARKYTYDTVLDAFCGAGGNTIQFAHTSKKVIAIDIDPAKVEMARHNAAVYGVEDRIQFIVGDFFELAKNLQADMVFLSPPWGGPGYSSNAQYDIETMLLPKPASELMSVARTISPTISLYLPRNTRPDQILSLAKEVGGSVEVEQSYLDKRFVAITAYFY